MCSHASTRVSFYMLLREQERFLPWPKTNVVLREGDGEGDVLGWLEEDETI